MKFTKDGRNAIHWSVFLLVVVAAWLLVSSNSLSYDEPLGDNFLVHHAKTTKHK